MSKNERFRVNAPSVTAESFDGEVVVINLRSGFYYSSVGVGADIWDALSAGATRTAITEGLVAAFGESRETISASVDRFLGDLLAEELIVPVSSGIPGGAGEMPKPTAKVFSDPVLQKYEDMEELLLLDPIHDVDEAGWPVTEPVGEVEKKN